MKTRRTNIILLVVFLGLILFSLGINKGAEFAGADEQAEEVIAQINPDYEPWFNPLWEPPSGEIESLLFAVQAALGCGFICFYFGYKYGQKGKTAEVSSERN
ncbi:Cobalt transport protein CbiN [Syntrophomonas zehnderi OL-4]|uniref:Cobalt transport protein CbiN n=1 Tax=Syntrophomonas zehnderi OL-4 TaxID=690567 RepID=A0A0E4GCH9_9FIRM|nr:energy-coupling factor ABC transporter substrate-binding protein [Syntrophomonas zehnderi]CFX97976.1 Cobalt transport protein CbiN [Syntrophomonas zehnderi OL-4]